MPQVLLLIYLLLISAVGYLLMSSLLGPARRHWGEAIGLSLAGGIGATSMVLFWISTAGFAPAWAMLIALAAVTAIGLMLLHAREGALMLSRPLTTRPKWDIRTALSILALIVLLLASVNVAVELSSRGLADIDAFGIWMLKAKVTAAIPLRPIPSELTDPSFSYSHQDYPLGFPLLVAGLYAAVGDVNDQLGKLAQAPIYVALLLVIYATLRERLQRRWQALAITALLLAAPVLVQHAGMPVAELLLVLQHACCLTLLLRWMENRRPGDLIAAGMFAAFAAFSKNEGLALLPLVGLAAIVFAIALRDRPALQQCLFASVSAIAIIAPWLIYRHFLPRTHEDYGTKLTSATTVLHDLPRLTHVLPAYFALFIQLSTAGGIWIVLVIVALVRYRRFACPAVLVFWGLLLAHLGLYAATFMVTPWELDVLMPMVGPKLLMHAAPAAAILIGLHMASEATPAGSPAALPRGGSPDAPALAKRRT